MTTKKIIRSQGTKSDDGISIRPAYYTDDNIQIDHRIHFDDEIELTDQSHLKQSDINVIMKQYNAQGVNPHIDPSNYRYGDVSEVPSLETMFNIVNKAHDAFMDLPADLRKLMDNDPSQLEKFISDPNNGDLLLRYGVISVPPKEPEAVTSATVNTTEPPVNTGKS